MQRRDLLTGSLKAVAGTSLLSHMLPAAQDSAACAPCSSAPFPAVPSPLAKLRVKPVMTNMVHSDVWEGPCRFNVVPVAKERENVQRSYQAWSKDLRSGEYDFGAGAEMLDPTLVVFDENFTLPAAALAELDQDVRSADVFFIAPQGSSNAAFDLVRHFGKPGILYGINCRTVDVAAYARTQGQEILIAQDGEELGRLMDLLRARKVFRETRVLFPTNRGFPAVASLTGITDLRELEERLGVQVKMIPYKALAEAMERTIADPAAHKKATADADDLIRGATQAYLDRDYVVRSLLFKTTIENLMETHSANAFTIECFEFCASRLPEKWKITPCLIHTLFKDAGMASSCEGDMGALLGMRLLMSLAGKSSHLGNMFLRDGKVLEINHSAPGIKMNGFDRPGMPYKLGRFVQSGWGTKAVVDFMQNPEKRVTVARMHPNARQVLVMKGKLVRSEGWDKDELGCSVAAFIIPAESGNAEPFVRKQAEYGNHLVWTYGDYAEPMRQLGSLMGLQVEVVS
jgi:cellobiose-specific phosphotransferase system component IIB